MSRAPEKPRKSTWSARGPMLSGFLALVLLVGGFGGWSALTTIQGAIVAPGLIEVEQNRQVVQHPDGGVVAEIGVVEGQAVQAGDVLLRLDGTLLQSELAIVEGQLFEILARRARLEAERDGAAEPVFGGEIAELAASRPDVAELIEGQRKLFVARADTLARQSEQLSRRLEQIAAQISGMDAQGAAYQRQVDLIRAEMANQQELLDKGLTQQARVMDLEREEARLLGNLGEVAGSKAQAAGRATEVELEILRIAAERREEANAQLRDIGPQEMELAERRRTLTERVARLEIRAPVSGVVLGLQVTTPRAVLRPADPVLYLIPQDRPLVIVAQVAPIHVDEISVGMAVRVVFPAFSARTMPEVTGHLSVISADAITDSNQKISYYRAEIELDAGEVAKLGMDKLVPGMPVEAFIQTAPRTPFAYLVKPFADYFNRAFRET